MTVLRDISFLWSMIHVIILFLLLFEPRYSWRFTLIASFSGAGFLLVANILLMAWLGHEIIMLVAFFTCTIPSMILFYLLSQYRDGRFFFLFCLSDTSCFWILQLTNLLDRMAGDTYVVLLISRLLLFPLLELLIWRYLRQPFLLLQRTLTRNWWLFVATGAIYYLLIMSTAIPVGTPLPDRAAIIRILLVMVLMPLTYFTIFRSLSHQIQVNEVNLRLELQRRDYEIIRQKMEVGRIYRHDMHHHLAALEGMLQQNQEESALQYIRDLRGKLTALTQKIWCSNAAVNSVLTVYLTQADNSGCNVETSIRLPSELPFSDLDLCGILSNALENATHACMALPEEERRIILKMELTDNSCLTLSIDNPCPHQVEMGPDGLPLPTRQGDHGLGLRSVRNIVEKYGGLLRCHWESGWFRFRTVLFPPQPQSRRFGKSK